MIFQRKLLRRGESWVVYGLTVNDRLLYVGATACLERRLRQHDGLARVTQVEVLDRPPSRLLAAQVEAEYIRVLQPPLNQRVRRRSAYNRKWTKG